MDEFSPTNQPHNQSNISAEQSDAFELFTIVQTLSMDCTSEFFIQAGLSIERSDYLKDTCRIFVKNHYDGLESPKQSLPKLMKALHKDLGNHDFSLLEVWINNRYEIYHDQAVQAQDWIILFGRLAEYLGLEYPLATLYISDSKVTTLKLFFLTYIADAYRFRLRLCGIENNKSISDWDKYVYGNHTINTSPLDWISNQITFMRQVSHWEKIHNLLDPSELSALEQWGTEQAHLIPEQEAPRIVWLQLH